MDNLNRDIDFELRKFDEESRTVQFVISTETKDAHGTVIPIEAWNLERYNRNGVVHYQHKYNSDDPDNVIGKGKVWIEDRTLIGEVEFEPAEMNTLAEKVFRKVQFGTLSATSVGFLSKKAHWGDRQMQEDEDTLYFDEVELFEFSIVNVPSNPDAVKRFVEEYPKPQTQEEESKAKSSFDEYDARYLLLIN